MKGMLIGWVLGTLVGFALTAGVVLGLNALGVELGVVAATLVGVIIGFGCSFTGMVLGSEWS